MEGAPDGIDSGTMCRIATPARGPIEESGPALTAEEKALLADLVQMVLDLVGIVEPTPFADLTNATISLARSDWSGAGLSLLGTVPYIGDTAKTAKLPRWMATLDRCIAQSSASRQFANAVRPLLVRVYCALDDLPLEGLLAPTRSRIKELRTRLAAFVGAPGRLARASRLLETLRGRVDDPDMVLDAMEAALRRGSPVKAQTPVDDFLAEALDHLNNFDGRPTLRLTTRPEYAARASDTFGEPLGKEPLRLDLRAYDMGRYLVPGDTVNAIDRNGLALPFEWNRASAIERQEIPAGAVLLDGIAKGQAGYSGGKRQLVHLGQMSPDGRILKAPDRKIVDGYTRLPGGQVSGTH